MKILVLSEYMKNNLNAGPKAKVDVETILHNEFNADIKTFYAFKPNLYKKIKRYIEKKYFCHSIKRKYDCVLIQSPFTTKKSIIKNLPYKILLIHDIDGLRTQNEEMLKKEIDLYNACDAIIAHNEIMKEFLIKKGIHTKIYTIEVFDYLCNFKQKMEEKNGNELQVIYTGNLDKAPFLKELNENKMNFTMNVYGVGGATLTNPKITYKGKYQPDEVPNHIVGNLGLIWDGSIEGEDILKNYTKYNNPHKFSCYLAAGIPVVAWNKSAIASFIKKYDIGYVINELYELNDINLEDYKIKNENAKKIGSQIREGYFTKKVIREVLSLDKDSEKNED